MTFAVKKSIVVPLILMLVVWTPAALRGGEGAAPGEIRIAVVLEKNESVYKDTLEGFESVVDAKIHKIRTAGKPAERVMEAIRLFGADLVLAFGGQALETVSGMKGRPVIFLHVLIPREIIGEGKRNFYGVGMYFSVESEFRVLHAALGGKTRRIGTIYGKRTEFMVEPLRRAAGREAVEILALDRRSVKRPFHLLEAMKGKIDAFWILPDPVVYDLDFIADLFLFSRLEKTPVYSSFEQYVHGGATLALHLSPRDVGRQAGAMAEKLLAGEAIEGKQLVEPVKKYVTINDAVVKEVGFKIDIKGVEQTSARVVIH